MVLSTQTPTLTGSVLGGNDNDNDDTIIDVESQKTKNNSIIVHSDAPGQKNLLLTSNNSNTENTSHASRSGESRNSGTANSRNLYDIERANTNSRTNNNINSNNNESVIEMEQKQQQSQQQQQSQLHKSSLRGSSLKRNSSKRLKRVSKSLEQQRRRSSLLNQALFDALKDEDHINSTINMNMNNVIVDSDDDGGLMDTKEKQIINKMIVSGNNSNKQNDRQYGASRPSITDKLTNMVRNSMGSNSNNSNDSNKDNSNNNNNNDNDDKDFAQ